MARHGDDWAKYLRIVGAYIPELLRANEEFLQLCVAYDVAPPKVYGHASGSAGTDRKAELDRSTVNTTRFKEWKPGASTQLAAAMKKKDEAAMATGPKPAVHVSADKKLQQLYEQEAKKVLGDLAKHAGSHKGLGCAGCRPIQDKHVEWHNHRKIPRPCEICTAIKGVLLAPAAGR